MILNYDKNIHHYQLLIYKNPTYIINHLAENNCKKSMSSINIRKNSIESSIDEIREMMAKITLKYKKNKNNSFFNDNQ